MKKVNNKLRTQLINLALYKISQILFVVFFLVIMQRKFVGTMLEAIFTMAVLL